MRKFRLEEESECSYTGEEAGAGYLGGSTVAVEPLRVEIMVYLPHLGLLLESR